MDLNQTAQNMQQKLIVTNVYDRDFAAWLEWNEQQYKKDDITVLSADDNNLLANYENEMEKKWLANLHLSHRNTVAQTWCG